MASYDVRQDKYIETGMNFVTTVTRRILENLEGQEREQELEKMRETMEQYIVMKIHYHAGRDVLERIKKGLDIEHASVERDVEAEYKEGLAAELEKRQNELNKSSLLRHPDYIKLEQIIKGSSGDGDLVAGEQTETFIDPWSKKSIENPVRNSRCGHVYEQTVAAKMCSKSKRLKCPMVGCTNDNMRMEHLVAAPDVLTKIQKQRGNNS